MARECSRIFAARFFPHAFTKDFDDALLRLTRAAKMARCVGFPFDVKAECAGPCSSPDRFALRRRGWFLELKSATAVT